MAHHQPSALIFPKLHPTLPHSDQHDDTLQLSLAPPTPNPTPSQHLCPSTQATQHPTSSTPNHLNTHPYYPTQINPPYSTRPTPTAGMQGGLA